MPIRPPLLVTDPVNIRYLTGMDMSAGAVFLRKTGATLFTDGRYIERARGARRGMAVRHVRELADVLRRVRRCGFEVEHVTVARREAWRKNFPQTLFVPCKDVIECRRRRKRPDENHCRNSQRTCSAPSGAPDASRRNSSGGFPPPSGRARRSGNWRGNFLCGRTSAEPTTLRSSPSSPSARTRAVRTTIRRVGACEGVIWFRLTSVRNTEDIVRTGAPYISQANRQPYRRKHTGPWRRRSRA